MLLAEIKSDTDKFCEVISKTLAVDVLIVDSNLKTVSNTHQYFDKYTFISRSSVIGRVIVSGETLAIDDRTNFNACKNCPDFYDCEMTGIIGVPIFYNDAVVGAIALVIPKQRVPSVFKDVRNSIAFVENMSALLSSKIQNRDDYNTLNIIRREREVLMDSISDAIVSTDEFGRIQYYNRQFRTYFEIKEDCTGSVLSQIIPHKIIIDFLKHTTDTREKMVYAGEGGNIFCGYVSCSSISINGTRNGMLFLFRHISDIKLDWDHLSAGSPNTSFERLAEHVFRADIIQKAKRLAMSDTTVLIQGEKGTGKRLLAQCMHDFSKRGQFAMVSINCGWLSYPNQEDFLFGELGRLQVAHKSTLFFHHIERLPLHLQQQLATFLQTRTLRNQGIEIPLDVRMIFSTSQDPEKLIEKGALLDRLYYSISQTALSVQPLRCDKDRLKDLLCERAKSYGSCNGKPELGIHPEAMELLLTYAWPENLREVETTMARLSSICEAEILPTDVAQLDIPDNERLRPPKTLGDIEKEHIISLLQTNHSKDEIARMLNIGRATLYRKIKEYQLKELS